MNEFDDAARDLGLEDNPLIKSLMQLLRATDVANETRVKQELARIDRITATLDSVRPVKTEGV